MSNDLTNYRLTVPEEFVGIVSSELHKRGAWLDSLENNDDGILTIDLRIHVNNMIGFEDWLRTKAKCKGSIKAILESDGSPHN